MTREEQRKEASYEFATKFGGKDPTMMEIVALWFRRGAKWSDEHPADYDGKAMLHILNKGVEQGKREMLDKTCEWLENNLLNYWQQVNTDSSNFIEDFRKAMEE